MSLLLIGNMGSALLITVSMSEINEIVMAFDVDDHELINTKVRMGSPFMGFLRSKRISKEGIQTAILTGSKC